MLPIECDFHSGNMPLPNLFIYNKIPEMKLFQHSSIVFLVLVTLMSCQSKRDKLFSEISVAEKELHSDTISMSLDHEKADKLIMLYLQFVESFPDDNSSPDFLFKAGEISNGLNRYDQAIELFERLHEKYPASVLSPTALFLQGFIYETRYYDAVNARKKYEKFIDLYPEHELIDDVRFSVENLGLDLNEVVERLQSQSGVDSVQKIENVVSEESDILQQQKKVPVKKLTGQKPS
jgi:tetratricopeptide (TPR) repeat protein